MYEKIIDSREKATNWRERYRYGLYNHTVVLKDGIAYAKPLIVIRNDYDVIVRFTNLHDYVGIYESKIFVPITSNAEAKLHYVCMMLNYVLIKNYDRFRIDHIFDVNREILECFFRDYALEKQSNGKYRNMQSIEKCVITVTEFFRKLHMKYGSNIALNLEDLHTETSVRNKYGKLKTKKTPAFQVKGIPQYVGIFRELPTKAFKILIGLAFRYASDIAFALCLQAFAGLRAGEVCNVRQDSIIFTKIDGRTIKSEIDLTREMPMRSDGVMCGKIKKERKQCVYPPFLEAFVTAHNYHKRLLSSRNYESEYSPMFINNRGKAMTYDDYARRFRILIDNHFRQALLECADPECRIYGQLLYENTLGLHSLRHWFSVQLVLNGEDIAQIQYWRGDKNPESAFTYLQNKGDLVRELENAADFLADILMQHGEGLINEKD